MNAPGLLTLLLAIPLAGAVGVSFAPARTTRALSIASCMAALGASLTIATRFDPAVHRLQLAERAPWIPALAAEYHLAIDGFSIGFVLLTAILVPLILLGLGEPLRKDRGLVALILALQGMLFGAFLAQNFLLWFLCYELTLVPAYLLIRLWGGPGRAPASLQFFLTTQLGGVAILIGFLAIYHATGTLDLPALARLGASGTLGLDGLAGLPQAAGVVFGLVVFGLAVKLPLLPVHTWLPPAYAEAPAPVTMLLTGLLSKLGFYGLLRLVLPLFPRELETFRIPLTAIATLTVIASALAALAQSDLKRVLAYSSINHLGLCALALFATAGRPASDGTAPSLTGALLLAISHGITAPALFWFASILEYRAAGTRDLGAFGGLRARMPWLAGSMGVAIFASLGLPGLNGFPGELLIFSDLLPTAPAAGAIALAGLLVTAIFMIRILHRIFHGPLAPAVLEWPDLCRRERWVSLAFVLLILATGLWPRLVTDLFGPLLETGGAPVP